MDVDARRRLRGAGVPVSQDETCTELLTRLPAASVFLIVGSGCIVVGGSVAALTGPAGLDRGSWLAAYLVLVGGAAQIVLGGGQAWLSQRVPPAHTMRNEAWSWNIGLVAVIVGTLASMPVVTSVGGAASVAALGWFNAAVRPERPSFGRVGTLYRIFLCIVLVSTVVGLVLAWLRHG